jgi:hypothetical protein
MRQPSWLIDPASYRGEMLREQIAEAVDSDSQDELLFTRLLTDDGGRLLDTTELGRYPSARLAQAIKIRAGSCRFPACTVSADRCDLDHHEPIPRGVTSTTHMDPFCRRHHRGKTFAWLACERRLRRRLDHPRCRTLSVRRRPVADGGIRLKSIQFLSHCC